MMAADVVRTVMGIAVLVTVVITVVIVIVVEVIVVEGIVVKAIAVKPIVAIMTTVAANRGKIYTLNQAAAQLTRRHWPMAQRSI